MTEPTAAPWRTPKGGYRIDVASEIKYLLLSSGSEVSTETTECELELWQICEAQREKIQKLVSALQIIADWPFDVMGDCVKDATSLAKSAIVEVEKE